MLASSAVGWAALTATTLSFLGLGVQPPTASWGNMVQEAMARFDKAWWTWFFPSFNQLAITPSLGVLAAICVAPPAALLAREVAS